MLIRPGAGMLQLAIVDEGCQPFNPDALTDSREGHFHDQPANLTNPTARLVVCGGITQRGRMIFSMRARTGTTRWIDADK